jgi:alanyl-tRNA synthetase
MTQKLFENNSYVKEFTATVTSCEEKDGKFFITLDKTAFFPEGGGQAPDKGTINGISVLDVQEKGNEVVHTVESALKVGEEVNCNIDWALRFSRMQNHCAEHILSGVIHKMFGYNNVGFHMNDSLVTFDVDGPLTAEDIEKVEKEANRAVFVNAEIKVSYPTKEEFETTACRSKIELDDGVRLITIEDFDTCACCAPHPMRAGEIGIIKIINYLPNKGGTRIEMVAGALALADYSYLHTAAKTIMKQLSSKRDEIAESVKKLGDDLSAAKGEIKSLSEKLAAASLKTEKVGNAVVGFTPDADFNALRNIANGMLNSAEYIALFSFVGEDSYNYLVTSKNGDTRDVAKALNTAFSGKGGGRPDCVQGKITASCGEDIVNFLKEGNLL